MAFGLTKKKKEDREKINKSLKKTRRGVFSAISDLFQANEIDDEMWDDLEALLIQADIGVDTSLALVSALREKVSKQGIKRVADAYDLLKTEMAALLQEAQPWSLEEPRLLHVVMVVGVNGSGKTTSIGKLAYYLKQNGRRVVLAAADTFRAAAIDQLEIWGERAGVDVIAQKPGSDPGAVVYDAIRASQASRQAEVLIIDTAGRLHTRYNLMKELEKLRTIAAKQVHRAPHEILLVLDATTGQNALTQAEKFKEAVNLTGVILTKLDGTAKGGMVFAIQEKLGIPVRFVGTGEGIEDFAEFDPEMFVESLFAPA